MANVDLSLLAEFADVFEDLVELPRQCRLDHQIPLLPGTALVAVRPYRYPQLLEDAIKR